MLLGDMLSVDKYANVATEATVQKKRSKFRQLVPLLTRKDVSHLTKEKS